MDTLRNAPGRLVAVAVAMAAAGVATASCDAGSSPIGPVGELRPVSQSDGAAGPDGAVWFTVPERGLIGRVAPDGTLDYLSLGTGALPRALAFDAQGRLWTTTTDPRAFIVRIELSH